MWSSEIGVTIHNKNENNNDFKLGSTIQSKRIKFWKKINMKKILELIFSWKQSLWWMVVEIYSSSSYIENINSHLNRFFYLVLNLNLFLFKLGDLRINSNYIFNSS